MSPPLGLYIISPSNAVRDAIRRTAAQYLVLMNDAIPLADEFPGLYTIARLQSLFGDCEPLRDYTLTQAFDRGVHQGRVMLASCYRPTINAYMSANEASPQTIIGAEQRGAFEAGAASIVHRDTAADYAALHFSTGTTEADIFVAAWREFTRRCPHLDRVVLCYHGYARGDDAATRAADAPDFERRPWHKWRPAVLAAGLPWPKRIIMTEAGYDYGPTDPPHQNGYRYHLNSEEYGVYLRNLPSLVPECEAFCIFVCGTY